MNNLQIKLNIKNEELKNRIWFSDLEIKPGINILFGGNGAGKTSFFNLIQSKTQSSSFESFEKVEAGKDIDILVNNERFTGIVTVFSNSINNASCNKKADKMATTLAEMVRMYQGLWWSEGMNVAVTDYDFLYYLENGYEQEGSVFIFMDEIDSGLDALTCRQIMQKLFKIVNDRPDKFYILLTFNQYEIARTALEEFTKANQEPVWINIYSGKEESIPGSYESYFKYLETQKTLHRRKGDEGAWGADESDWWDPINKCYNKDKSEVKQEDSEESWWKK